MKFSNADSETDVAGLLQALDALSAPLEPLDASAIDGFLTGVVLQRLAFEPAWRQLIDPDGLAPNVGPDAPFIRRVLNVLQSRHRSLDRAIEQRTWFDPWIFEVESEDENDDENEGESEGSPGSIRAACAPWAAGFAMAMEHAPGLMAADDPDLVDALALIFAHFDPEDLEDADDVLAAIEDLEPARDLAEAVEDLVTATLRLADIARPRRSGPRSRGSAKTRRRQPR